MKEIAREARGRGKKIGFVPTMGYLHEGHLSLVRRAAEISDLTVVSIFVNPTQFGPKEDLERYPRDLARDTDLCAQEGIDVLFHPETADMYPEGYRTLVDVEGLSQVMCGISRPTHFSGVATVCLKLFHIVMPTYAFFGRKDYQQLVLIRRMVRDLDLDVEIIGGATVREEDGLALSSRNNYLPPSAREAAPVLYRALQEGRRLILEEGEREAEAVDAAMREVLDAEPEARLDYLAITDPETLEPLGRLSGTVLLALAAYFGNTRLIDNLEVKVPAEE
jgi:pantoate--beta-alanine ligase